MTGFLFTPWPFRQKGYGCCLHLSFCPSICLETLPRPHNHLSQIWAICGLSTFGRVGWLVISDLAKSPLLSGWGNLFYTYTIPYQLRTSKLEQPLRRTGYGLRTYSRWITFMEFYLNDHSDIAYIDFNEFKAFLNTWKGPDIFQYAIPLLWWLPVLWVVYLLVSVVYLDIYWYLYCKFTCFFYLMIVYLHNDQFSHCIVYINLHLIVVY